MEKASVSPRKALLGARGGVRIEFRIAGAAPADVSIRIVGEGREVRRIDLADVPAGTEQIETWDRLTNAGTPAPDGSYRVLIGPPGGDAKQVGKLTLFGHFFPVRGPHGTRGPVGEFGAARSGGRIHIGFDVTARCGTPLAAVRAGTVVKRAFDPRLDGNFVVIRGLGERRRYQYSHMVQPSPYQQGDEVHPGDIIGPSAAAATRPARLATCISRSTSAAARSTRSPRCAPGTASRSTQKAGCVLRGASRRESGRKPAAGGVTERVRPMPGVF